MGSLGFLVSRFYPNGLQDLFDGLVAMKQRDAQQVVFKGQRGRFQVSFREANPLSCH